VLPALGENYVSATLNGVTDARLLDGQNRRIRTLIEHGPVDGEHTLLFALPVRQSTSLVLHGEEGTLAFSVADERNRCVVAHANA
jgi:enterochelin esterase family protein